MIGASGRVPVRGAPNESSLCQELMLEVFVGASVRPVLPVVVALVVGPGVASPKNRLSGCETGHAGFESFLLALPGPRCSAIEPVRVGEELAVDGVADVSLQ